MEPQFDRRSSVLERVLTALVVLGIVGTLLGRLVNSYVPDGDFLSLLTRQGVRVVAVAVSLMTIYVLMPREGVRRVRSVTRVMSAIGFLGLLVLFLGDTW